MLFMVLVYALLFQFQTQEKSPKEGGGKILTFRVFPNPKMEKKGVTGGLISLLCLLLPH